jgi:NAD(P)-dependent dehydrogenase (short-subunit alcohol dehydrogenase family)
MSTKRRFIITGLREGGIGFATAWRLAVEEGGTVFACEKDLELGEAAARRLIEAGGDVHLIRADVSQREDVSAAVDFVRQHGDGTLDGLVNNAGDAGDPAADCLARMTPELFYRIVTANFFTAIWMTRECVLRCFLPRRSGVTIFLSTNNGFVGMLGQLIYGASKQAVAAACRTMAAEFGGTGLRFCTVSPGACSTDSPNWKKRRRQHPNWERIEGGMNAAGRMGRPEDVARLISFLVSDEASFLNGCDIPIDGGLRMSGVMFPGWDATNARESYVALAHRLEERSREAA